MRVLVATDAWHPQVNGVVRTLTALRASASRLGSEVTILSPDGFPSLPLPTYPGLRVAVPNRAEIGRRIRAADPDAIHIATEGPIGRSVRAYCGANRLPFTTAYTTKFPEYISARFRIPERWSYAVLRRFHAAAALTMVSTPTLMRELRQQGFRNLALWTRGVDTDAFRPNPATPLGLPRPIFLSAGRIAVEKNLPAFLSLDLPGSKVVIGDGPQEGELRRRFPDAHFLGVMSGDALSAHIAAADVFVFPSRTDTYGVVQLEALACGVPVAAFPVPGPIDVVGASRVGVLHEDLRVAALAALGISRQECRAFALGHSWERSARQFIDNAGQALMREPRPGRKPAGTAIGGGGQRLLPSAEGAALGGG